MIDPIHLCDRLSDLLASIHSASNAAFQEPLREIEDTLANIAYDAEQAQDLLAHIQEVIPQ